MQPAVVEIFAGFLPFDKVHYEILDETNTRLHHENVESSVLKDFFDAQGAEIILIAIQFDDKILASIED